jgi:hypothetical protein
MSLTSCSGKGGGDNGFFDGAEIGRIVSHKVVSRHTHIDYETPDIVDITIQPYDSDEQKIITVNKYLSGENFRDTYTLVAKDVKDGKAGMFYIFDEGFAAARAAVGNLTPTPRLESEFTPGEGQIAIRSVMIGQSIVHPYEGYEVDGFTGQQGRFNIHHVQRMIWLESGDVVLLEDSGRDIPGSFVSWGKAVQEGRVLDVVVSKDDFMNLDADRMKVTVSDAVAAVKEAGNLITADGVGPFMRGAVKPGKVGYYNVEYITDDPEFGTYHIITDGGGEEMLICYDNGRWDVRSDAFQLANGLRVGASLGLVQQTMGRSFNPALTMEEFPSPVYLIPVADKIFAKVGTHQARDLMVGASNFNDLDSGARVESIYIEK